MIMLMGTTLPNYLTDDEIFEVGIVHERCQISRISSWHLHISEQGELLSYRLNTCTKPTTMSFTRITSYANTGTSARDRSPMLPANIASFQ